MIENREEKERVILVGVCVSDGDDTEASLEELKELVKTAGAETVEVIIQNREAVHPGTYVGKGKIEEIAMSLAAYDADGIVCDDELSPAQMKNLEDALQCKVMDRTMVILDIFAQHARTGEGKLQVELAQLKYRATRLIGSYSAMSRIGGGAAGASGGIGTRGPGEKKLEVDRRLIKARISQLNRELEQVKKNREVARAMRERNRTPVVAVVGYTNAGKSTLLNTLTDAGVLEENKLFATLDTTTRILKLESKEQVLLTDTVGFIRKLPHHLVDAFRSTLEEAKYADMILHVVDASNPDMDAQMHIVYETLTKLGVKDKPIITAFNKQDLVEVPESNRDFRADRVVKISAKHGQGLPELLSVIADLLRENKVYVECILSYAEGNKLALIRKYGELLSEEYVAEGTAVKAYVPMDLYGQLFGGKENER
ncbi:MAG: GTPase HflX [Lachnospiraceae bacterium]|nr:GTPase HflX [Lachnospiraceae bacterium]